MDFKRLIIVCGHYGSGKTNFSLNLVLFLAKSGKKVTIVDLDIVNPYFRSCDYGETLAEKGIKLISPNYAGTTLDVPSLSPQINSVFSSHDDHIIFDVGGDEAGATALGGYAKKICDGGYDMLFVINKFRGIISKPSDAVGILREIEASSRLHANFLVNNSHMSNFTTAEDIIGSNLYAEEVSQISSLPIKYTVVNNSLAKAVENAIPNIFPVEIIVKPLWI